MNIDESQVHRTDQFPANTGPSDDKGVVADKFADELRSQRRKRWRIDGDALPLAQPMVAGLSQGSNPSNGRSGTGAASSLPPRIFDRIEDAIVGSCLHSGDVRHATASLRVAVAANEFVDIRIASVERGLAIAFTASTTTGQALAVAAPALVRSLTRRGVHVRSLRIQTGDPQTTLRPQLPTRGGTLR